MIAMPSVGEPGLDEILAYWGSKQAGRAMPARADIDPVEIGPRLLPFLMLTEFQGGDARVRVRLAGTAVVDRFGVDPTRRFIDEAFAEDVAELLLGPHRDLHRLGVPSFSEWLLAWADGRSLVTRALFLPLSQGSGSPAQALVGFAFRSASRRTPSLRGEVPLARAEEAQRIVFMEFKPRRSALA